MTGFICGPAKGTVAKPYRCICCRVAFADIEQLLVSMCGPCVTGNLKCTACRERGVPLNDSRVGGYRKYRDTLRHYGGGGLLHRFTKWRGSLAVMRCGKRIPRAYLGGAVAVVPPCRFCWPMGYGY